MQQAPVDVPLSPSSQVPGLEHGLERLWQLHGDGASSATTALTMEGHRNPGGQRWHRKSVAAVLGQPALAAAADGVHRGPTGPERARRS